MGLSSSLFDAEVHPCDADDVLLPDSIALNIHCVNNRGRRAREPGYVHKLIAINSDRREP